VPDQGLLGLQARAGNAAVVRMLRQIGHPGAQDAPEVQRAAAHDVLRQPGRPLNAATRSEMETRLGTDLSDVRLHDDRAAQRSAAELGATAYTSGSHVVIGENGGDKHTLAHELTHVIQQRQGPVAGTDNGAGLRVSDPSDRFEREAEASARTATYGTTPGRLPDVQRPASPGPTIQRTISPDLANWATDPASQQAFPLLNAGRFWGEPQQREGVGGRDLIATLSSRNAATLNTEIGPDTGWQDSVREKVERTLRDRCVLRHYTTLARAQTMLADGGQLKSTEKLQQDAPPGTKVATNSDADIEELGNHGFVYFFIEPENQTGRDTRFAGGPLDKPARITVPFDLLTANGWIMLTDFVVQDFPSIRANAAGELYSYKAGSSVEEQVRQARLDFGLPLEVGEDGNPAVEYGLPATLSGQLPGGPSQFSNEEWASVRNDILTLVKREAELRKLKPRLGPAAQYDRQVRRFGLDEDSEEGGGAMDYGKGTPGITLSQAREREQQNPADKEFRRYQEYLHGNILAGPQIVPGLASRCILEISRVEGQNPNLANQMKAMTGDQLVGMLLKDFLRPQAMLPWSVAVTEANVREG
jgi:hypothetical protein